MFVLFVFIRADIEFGLLGITLHRDVFGFAFLLRIEGGDRHPPETEFGLDTEKALCSADQVGVQRHVHIACLDELDDVILLPFIFQFQLVLKFEGGFRVVIDFEFNFIADFGDDIHLDLFVEIEVGLPALAGVKHGVVAAVGDDPEVDFCRALGPDIDGVVTKNGFKDLSGDYNLGYDPFGVVNTGCFRPFLPVFGDHGLHVHLLELLEGEGGGNAVTGFPDLIDIIILAGRRIVLNDGFKIGGIFQVNSVFFTGTRHHLILIERVHQFYRISAGGIGRNGRNQWKQSSPMDFNSHSRKTGGDKEGQTNETV